MTKLELIHQLRDMEVREETKRISDPAEAVAIFAEYASKDVEYFLVTTMDAGHRVINTHEISKGILDRTIVHPREVFYEAIRDRAAAVILGHNHPSGNKDPSLEDNDLTKRLVNAGVILGIPVLDHLIVCLNGYYSYLEEGKLNGK